MTKSVGFGLSTLSDAKPNNSVSKHNQSSRFNLLTLSVSEPGNFPSTVSQSDLVSRLEKDL